MMRQEVLGTNMACLRSDILGSYETQLCAVHSYIKGTLGRTLKQLLGGYYNVLYVCEYYIKKVTVFILKIQFFLTILIYLKF